jgi:NADH-quinone oxidoreductase subunit N
LNADLLPQLGEYTRLLPEIILSVFGTALMVLNPLVRRRGSPFAGNIAIVGLALALFGAIYANMSPGDAFSHMIVVDGYATFFRVLVISIGIVVVLGSYSFLSREGAESGEFHSLILFSIVGQCILSSANELIMIFIGLEISSIATYILAGYFRDDKRANEAAIKYFLLGSFATAFFLYGISIVYGATGSTNLALIHARFANAQNGIPPVLFGIAAALMFVGLAFKVSAAPFQIWAPDVYQGAPSPVSAFLSAGPKAAAFSVFLRIFLTAFPSISNGWVPLIWISALLSMTIGNFAALRQSNVKRMLAYSSIAHAGYVMVALASHSNIGAAAAMFYLAAYACMNVGAFLVISHIGGKGERHVQISDFNGLGARQPLTAALLTLFLLSLIGVPLTGGFFGKFYIFQAALEANMIWLTVLGLLNSGIAAYYYLRIIGAMYMQEPLETTPMPQPLSASTGLALILPAIGTLVLGIFPATVLNFAIKSANFGK